MSRMRDLTGQRFGRLIVEGISHRSAQGRIYYLCKCICGKGHVVQGSNLHSGHVTSCGCFQREEAAIRFITHGASYTRPYRIWRNMIQRCENADEAHRVRYQARGIRVCPGWRNSFAQFHKWALKNGYEDNLTIDRIDNDGNYEPSNCRWIPLAENVARSASRRKKA